MRFLLLLSGMALVLGCNAQNLVMHDVEDEEGLARQASHLDAQFQEAGAEFDVPAALLKAIAFARTRYQMVRGEEEFEGQPRAMGAMALSGAALVEGARLAGVTQLMASEEPLANIRAGAALLSSAADELAINRTALRTDLRNWAPVVSRFSGIATDEGKREFVRGEVYGALRQGLGVLTDGLMSTGQSLELDGELGQVQQRLASPDFAGGFWRPSRNYGTRASGYRPSVIVIHTCESAYPNCWSYLVSNTRGVSAHYVVANGGEEVSQLVREEHRAYHIGASYDCNLNGGSACSRNGVNVNHFSVGIEHGGYASQTTFPSRQLDTSARLTCSIARRHGMPIDRQHVVGHGQLQPYNRTDPGRNWPWNDYLQRIKVACGEGVAPAEPPPPPPPPPKATWLRADVTGDGRSDLVHVHALNPGIRVHSLHAKADGSWTQRASDAWPGFGASDAINWSAADVNGDGRADLVHVYFLNPGLRVHTLLSNGDGGWTQRTSDVWSGFAASDVQRWRLADMNGDGLFDLVHLHFRNPGIRVHMLLSSGDGAWTPTASDAWPGFGAGDVDNWRLMDANGDGKTDLVHTYFLNPGLRVHTLFSRGDGGFTQGIQDAWPGFGAANVGNWKSADVDGDGRADLVHVYYLNPGIRVHTLLSEGNGSWRQAAADPWPGFGAADVQNWRLMDANGDGKADLVHVYFQNPGIRVHTLLANGAGGWRGVASDPWTGFAAGDTARWVATSLDANASADLTHVRYGAPGVRVHSLVSRGDGHWSTAAHDPWPSFATPFD